MLLSEISSLENFTYRLLKQKVDAGASVEMNIKHYVDVIAHHNRRGMIVEVKDAPLLDGMAIIYFKHEGLASHLSESFGISKDYINQRTELIALGGNRYLFTDASIDSSSKDVNESGGTSLENFTLELLRRKLGQGASVTASFMTQGSKTQYVDGKILEVRTLKSNPDFVIMEVEPTDQTGDEKWTTKHTMTAGFINKFLELVPGVSKGTFTLQRVERIHEEEEKKSDDDPRLPLMLRVLNNQVAKGKKVYLDAAWRDRDGGLRVFKGVYRKAAFKDKFMGLKNAVRILYIPDGNNPEDSLFTMGKAYTDVADGFEEAHEVKHNADGSMTLRNLDQK